MSEQKTYGLQVVNAMPMLKRTNKQIRRNPTLMLNNKGSKPSSWKTITSIVSGKETEYKEQDKLP